MTLPLIQDCVLIALEAVGFEISGSALIVNCLTDAATSILVNADSTAYVLDDEGTTYDTTSGGIVEPLASDRSAWDTLGFATRHASDIDDASFTYHSDPANPPLSPVLTNTHIFIGNASNVATDVAMSNDATMANTGALTIANQAVTYAKIQNISATQRVLGRNTAGAGSAEEVTASQELDWIGSTRGSILYRGASGWAILAPGTSGDALTSNGAGADPTYQATIPGAINVYNETYSGDGSTTIFYLANVAVPGTIRVYIDGVRQAASDDTDPTDQVVFSVAPFNGAALLFDYELYIA